MLNHHSLMHPRTLWEIEAAMRHLLLAPQMPFGYSPLVAVNRQDGSPILYACYSRGAIGAFRFWDNYLRKDVTPIVLKALRASTKGE